MVGYVEQMELELSVQYVKGVGPYIASLLAKKSIYTVYDLLCYLPFRYIDRRNIDTTSTLTVGKNKTIIGTVVTSGITWIGRKRKKIFEIIIKDGQGAVSAKWFNFNAKFMQNRFPSGTNILVAGEVSAYSDRPQFIHPEVDILDSDEDADFNVGGKILPIYPLTENLTQKKIRSILKDAWNKYSMALKYDIPELIIKKYDLLSQKESLKILHFPDNEDDIDSLNSRKSNAHKSLILSEFLKLEIALNLKKKDHAKLKGIEFRWDNNLQNQIHTNLSFELTDAQKRTVIEIQRDMGKTVPMNRLIQGDVGSGKTIVALIAALQAINNGYQAAIMAPTEILAEQHFKSSSKILEELNFPSALVTGSVKGKIRDKIYESISSGQTKLIFGTHALIQDELKFHNLGFVIIDEQHRFGVMQRSKLHKKGLRPDVLVMTATPIPRTLALTLYGDLDVSIINELPHGRKPVLTKLYREKQREKLYQGIRKELERGHQTYVVYPLIEESEKIDLKNATEMSLKLKKIFEPKFRVELLHGKMKSDDKDNIMQQFKNGSINVLCSTSVVEVGVDVPNATVMIIEHAERFGLSQLHQLRGRVGRSSIQSYCILMAAWKASAEANQRLTIMQETNDGFRIAEEDLIIRGPGEFLGTKQSGLPDFHFADIVEDKDLLELAREIVETLEIDKYPEFKRNIIQQWESRLELKQA